MHSTHKYVTSLYELLNSGWVWTMKGMFIKQIEPDNAFFNKITDKSSTVYVNILLQEMIGNCFKRQRENSQEVDISVVSI